MAERSKPKALLWNEKELFSIRRLLALVKAKALYHTHFSESVAF